MKKPYHILDSAKQQRVSPDELTRLLSQNGQLMLPLVNLIEQCRGAVDEVIDVTGRAAIQAVLELSAQQVTGGELSQPGKKRGGEVLRLGAAIGPRESQRPQAAGGQAALTQTLRRRGRSARLRSHAGRRAAGLAHVGYSDERRFDASVCGRNRRNGRYGRSVEIGGKSRDHRGR